MRICRYCCQPENTLTRSCDLDVVAFKNGLDLASVRYDPAKELFERVEAGSMTSADARVILAQRMRDGCPDCGVAVGGVHHPDCSDEPCPRCGKFLTSTCECDRCCVEEYEDEDGEWHVEP